ncbi:FAR1 DNA binding domain-containing protein [Cynara cardunculus var. scolymus]|uniref:Protein FAR1-RELATED SEQUENCE n=1 Tax=Cynara cardunculus var. scolymus TaxID=59895 RepID=A0A103XW92_CYNCS|nr:FAR1 DNA binding domain-containing protein [Cynara cardunculus var. scolymus]
MALRLDGLSVTKPKGLNDGVSSSFSEAFATNVRVSDSLLLASLAPATAAMVWPLTVDEEYEVGRLRGGGEGREKAINHPISGKINESDFDTTTLTTPFRPIPPVYSFSYDRQAPVAGPASPYSIRITISFGNFAILLIKKPEMEDGSDKSEELLEDDGGDHDIDSEQVFAIGNNDVETESLFGIEGDDLENGSELVLDIESHEQENDSEQILEFENNDLEDKDQMIEFRSNNHNTDGAQMLEIGNNNQDDASISDDQQDPSESKHNPPPVVGMEFESYEDAYKYYNCYAKELGFAIRVKSSWTKRNSKEKRGAVLCCNCEGFKTLKEASSRRKETRTGCLAMIRLRLVESSRWRVDEVKLEHNHLFDPERAQNSKSHKRTDSGVKRKLEPTVDVEVRTIKLYRTPIVDAICYGSSNERDFDNEFGKSKLEEFEVAWDDMIQRFAIRDNEYLRKLFEDRERWAPVYSKDTYFAGMFTFQPGESTVPFFHGYVHQQTSLKEFFEMHDLVLQNKIQKEAFDDCESRDSNPKLRTICTYESQLSKVYTKQIFSLFQYEVEMMSNCFNISQVNTSGLIVTYMITEQETEGNSIRNLEVMFDKIGLEIRCICSCFNFKGYLCRHALSVLNHNGIDEIPSQYILSRWRKDFKRLYVPDLGSDNVDVSSPVQWFVHLHKQALQVVEEGMTSQEHYMVAWQAFKESLNKVRLVSDKQAQS